MRCRRFAYTLAEVLITVSVIGVVAVMSIPFLKYGSDEARYIASVKKAYETVQSATSMLEVTKGDMAFWDWSNNPSIVAGYKKTMSSDSSFTYEYNTQFMDGNSAITLKSENGFITNDGMLWYFVSNGATSGTIYVDINANQLPNRVGVDVFGFSVSKDGVYPLGRNTKSETEKDYACTNYVVRTSKMPWITDSSYKNCKDIRILNF